MPIWQQIIALVVVVWAFSCLNALAGAAAMSAYSIGIKEIKLGSGPVIWSWNLGNCPVRFGFIPYGACVGMDLEDYQQRSLFTRSVILFAPTVAMVLATAVFLGWDKGIHEFLSGFKQLIQGAFSPRSIGPSLLAAFFHTVSESPRLWLGLVAAKFAAFHSLPIPPLNIGRFFFELFSPGSKAEWCGKAAILGVLVYWALIIGWFIAVINYFFR